MINNPLAGLPSLEVTLQTPVASVSVSVAAPQQNDAISVTLPGQAPPPSPVTSLLEAAFGVLGPSGNPPAAGPGSVAPPAGTSPGADGGATNLASFGDPTRGGTPATGSPAGDPGGAGFANGGGVFATTGGVANGVAVVATTQQLEATLARFASQNPGSPAAGALASGGLAKALIAMALEGRPPEAGLPVSAASVVETAAALLQAAATASTAAGTAAALTALAQLAANQSADVATAAAALQAAATRPDAGAGVPMWDPTARPARPDRKSNVRGSRFEDDEREAMRLPQRDSRGRLYDAAERERLAELCADPHRGFAPEGVAAVAAEREHGLRFFRDASGRTDFVAADGSAWNVLQPLRAAGLELAVRDATRTANAVVSAAQLDESDAAALAGLLARVAGEAGSRRILVCEGSA